MRLAPLLALCVAASPAAGQGRTVTEHEPNDAPANALLVALDDTLTGAIDPRRDLDYFTFDVPSGTTLRIDRTGSYGSATFSRIELNLIDVDGQSSLVWLLEDHEYMAVEYPITYGGRYFLLVRVWDHDDPSPSNAATPQWTYRITLTGTPIALGPGEPVRPFYASTSSLMGFTTAPRDGILALTQDGILRVSPQGVSAVVVPYAALIVPEYWAGDQLVVDGFGNALITGHTTNANASVIWQVSLQDGAKTQFAGGPWLYGRARLLTGPDGDIWVGPSGVSGQPERLRRLTPFGDIKDSIAVDGLAARALAFSPAGDLHFSGIDGIYRLAQGQGIPRRVIMAHAGEVFAGLAFDRAGNLYATVNGEVVLYGADYQVRARPFARHPLLTDLGFATDEQGAPTTSLVGLVGWWKLAEMNPQGLLASGARVGATLGPLQLAGRQEGTVGQPFAATLSMHPPATGASWAVAWGRLPRGVTLSASGVVSGTPSEYGSFTFDARARAEDRVGYGRFTLRIAPQMSVALLAEAVLDPAVAATLDPALVASLDVNNNGILDVADMRAYLKARPQ